MQSRVQISRALVAILFAVIVSAQRGPIGSCFPPSRPLIDVQFPLNDFFPYTKPGSTNDTNIAELAHGIRSNRPLPKSLTTNTITSIKLMVQAFLTGGPIFTQILNYISDRKPGYNIADTSERDYAISSLGVFLGQEEQFTLACNQILEQFGVEPFRPCKYYWGFNDYDNYIFDAAMLTDAFLGLVQSITRLLARDGDGDLILFFLSISQSVGNRVGWYHSHLGLPPALSPFLTPIPREYYFSIYNQQVIVPGSCPPSNTIDLVTFDPLVIVQQPTTCRGVDQIVQFSVQSTDAKSISGYAIAYINQQNLPVTVPIMNSQSEGGCVTFDAIFPCSLTVLGSGLTIASVVNNTGPYKDADSLVLSTVFAPALFYQ